MMHFTIERVRLADDDGNAITEPRVSEACGEIDADSAETALQLFLTRDDYEAVGDPATLAGSRALLTVRKGKAFFALHVAPHDGSHSG